MQPWFNSFVSITLCAGPAGGAARRIVSLCDRRVARPDVNWAKPASNSKRSTTPPRVQRTNHVPAQQQRARDRDARAILQAELNKASARLRELQLEYNHGQPERLGSELNNHQKYLNRVAGLRNDIQRVESDLAGLRRELGRAGG